MTTKTKNSGRNKKKEFSDSYELAEMAGRFRCGYGWCGGNPDCMIDYSGKLSNDHFNKNYKSRTEKGQRKYRHR
jgi:hypothetical protein